jgi:hypothetical protein
LNNIGMRFIHPALAADHTAALQSNEPKRLAVAHNILFEQRVSPDRVQIAEDAAVVRGAENNIGTALEAHYRSRITAGGAKDHPTFSDLNAAAAYHPISEHEYLMRVENLTWEIDRVRPSTRNDVAGAERTRIQAAFEAVGKGISTRETDAIVNDFLEIWNSSYRDYRPMFAGFEAEIGSDAARPDWPVRLRDRLGLAHYEPNGSPLVVCIMRYRIAEVIKFAQQSVDPVKNIFLSPTVLDCGNWEYFFPAPKNCQGGRALYLGRVSDYANFFSELLHFRIDYERKHVFKIGVLNEPVTDCSLNCMRNSHLDAVQLAFDEYDFGLPMPDACHLRCPSRS